MRKLFPSRQVGLMATLALLLAPPLLSPQLGGASEGVGTEWRHCRADAHHDMALCYHEESESRFGYMMCNVAWELDLLGCDLDLVEAICRFDWCEKAR